MTAHVTSPADPQVIVVGTCFKGTWYYGKSKPMDYADAHKAVADFRTGPETTAFVRAADDPELESYELVAA